MSEQYDDLDELPAPPRKDITPADLELLTLAARALGATFEEIDGEGYGDLHFDDGEVTFAWNPLVHSDDAFNLVVKLNLWPKRDRWSDGEYIVVVLPNGGIEAEQIVGDAVVVTRRAVTRAAAEAGKQHSHSKVIDSGQSEQ
jgi:hypothetical protein